MNTEQFRAIIWDDLFQANSPKSIQELAALYGRDVSDVRTAVDHDWFSVADERVAIARVSAGTKYAPN